MLERGAQAAGGGGGGWAGRVLIQICMRVVVQGVKALSLEGRMLLERGADANGGGGEGGS